MTVAERPWSLQETANVFLIPHASWELYEQMLREFENQHIRLTYDQGRLVLMSPLPIHDRIKKLAGRLIETASSESGIRISSFGSASWKRKDLTKGLEADECYYVANEPAMRGKRDVDLLRDPPPDLAVEIDITHTPLDRVSIYGALGVSEIWRFDGERFEFVRRAAGGSYLPLKSSAAFPFMTPAILEQFIEQAIDDEWGTIEAFRQWVRTASGESSK